MQNQQKISLKKHDKVGKEFFPSTRTIQRLLPEPSISTHFIDPIPSYAEQVKKILQCDSKELKLTHQLQESQRKCEYMSAQLKAMESKLQEVVTELIYMKRKEIEYQNRICRIQESLKGNHFLPKSPQKLKDIIDIRHKKDDIEKSPSNLNLKKFCIPPSVNHKYANNNNIIQTQQNKKDHNENFNSSNLVSNANNKLHAIDIYQQNKQLKNLLSSASAKIEELQSELKKVQMIEYNLKKEYAEYKMKIEEKHQKDQKYLATEEQLKKRIQDENNRLSEDLLKAHLEYSQLKNKMSEIDSCEEELQRFKKQIKLKCMKLQKLQNERAELQDYLTNCCWGVEENNDSIEYIESFHIVENHFEIQQQNKISIQDNQFLQEEKCQIKLIQLVKKKIVEIREHEKQSYQQYSSNILKEYNKIQEQLYNFKDLNRGLELTIQNQIKRYLQMEAYYEEELGNKNKLCEKYEQEQIRNKQIYAKLEQGILNMSRELKQKESKDSKKIEQYEKKFTQFQSKIHNLVAYNLQLQNLLEKSEQKNIQLSKQCQKLKKQTQINSIQTTLFIQQLQKQNFTLKLQYQECHKEDIFQKEELIQRLAKMNEKAVQADLYLRNEIDSKDKKIQYLENVLADSNQKMTKMIKNFQDTCLYNKQLQIQVQKLYALRDKLTMLIEDYRGRLLQQQEKQGIIIQALKSAQYKLKDYESEKKFSEEQSKIELERLKMRFHQEIAYLQDNFKKRIDKNEIQSQKRCEEYFQTLRKNQQKNDLDWGLQRQRYQNEKQEKKLVISKYEQDNKQLKIEGNNLRHLLENLKKQKQQLNALLQSIKEQKEDELITKTHMENDLRDYYEHEISALKSENMMLKNIYTKFAGLIVEGCMIQKEFEESEKSSLKQNENESEKKTLKGSIDVDGKENFNQTNNIGNIGISQTQSKVAIRIEKSPTTKTEMKKDKVLI